MSISVIVPPTTIAAFCRRERIRWLALFGSVLRNELRHDSDIDVLVEFEPGRRIGFIELAGLEAELTELFGRRVDLRTPQDLSEHFRAEVVATAHTLYAST
jgi:predicted nucleotidyltransferase